MSRSSSGMTGAVFVGNEDKKPKAFCEGFITTGSVLTGWRDVVWTCTVYGEKRGSDSGGEGAGGFDTTSINGLAVRISLHDLHGFGCLEELYLARGAVFLFSSLMLQYGNTTGDRQSNIQRYKQVPSFFWQ